MNPKIEELCKALNAAYAAKGINGVAVAVQIGRCGWAIKCSFDTHDEMYLVEQTLEGAWQFIRVIDFGV